MGKIALLSNDHVPASTHGASDVLASRREPLRQATYGPGLEHKSRLERNRNAHSLLPRKL